MYAAKRFCCGPGADKREPTKQFYTKLSVYNTVVLGAPMSGSAYLPDMGSGNRDNVNQGHFDGCTSHTVRL